MEEWLRIGIYQVQEWLDHDPEYQELQIAVNDAEARNLQIRQKLSIEDREYIDHYIALCEELEYQRTHTAYRCGKMRGNAGKQNRPAE